MAFKLVEEAFGQVTYMRIYQGTLKKGQFYWNSRQRKKARISRILRVHADEKEDIDSAGAGDIVAVMGIECATGDTYCDEGTNYSLESIYAAEPVIDLAVTPNKRADQDKLSKALNRFMREDPTFRVHVDKETSETIISGMGELHLEIYVERIRREYKVDCTVGMPKVSYREAPTKVTPFDYKHRKQTGGSGQYAHIKGVLEPMPEDSPEQFVFENEVTGGRIPSEYIPSVEKGFRDSLHKGPVAGYEVLGVKMILQDGSYHDVDSSDMAFQICARDCFRETFRKADPVLLEPIMKVEVEIPDRVPGARHRRRLLEAGRDPGHRGPRPVRRDPGRGPALRDVRLLERPPEHDPGQGELQHGVPQVPEAPRPVPGRDRQEGRSSRRPRPDRRTSEHESRRRPALPRRAGRFACFPVETTRPDPSFRWAGPSRESATYRFGSGGFAGDHRTRRSRKPAIPRPKPPIESISAEAGSGTAVEVVEGERRSVNTPSPRLGTISFEREGPDATDGERPPGEGEDFRGQVVAGNRSADGEVDAPLNDSLEPAVPLKTKGTKSAPSPGPARTAVRRGRMRSHW